MGSGRQPLKPDWSVQASITTTRDMSVQTDVMGLLRQLGKFATLQPLHFTGYSRYRYLVISYAICYAIRPEV